MHWTVEQEQILETMAAEGRTAKEIADRLGATVTAVYMKARRRRIQFGIVRGNRRGHSWTPDREDELCRLFKAGLSARQIGAQLGVTRNAVIGKAHRLGLVWTQRNSTRLMDREYRQACDCLKRGAKRCAVTPIRKSWDADNCATFGCLNPPMKYYGHGLCRQCNEHRLNDMRRRANMREVAA